MMVLLIAVGTFFAYLVAYNTYGRWLARKIFALDRDALVPSVEVNDGRDYVPTRRGIVFGHHFTSIAGTGPIVGPAIAVFWGWLPALLWVLVGSIFIGAVHDFGALVVSLRSRGQTVGDVAARMLNPRARLLFLVILFMALTVVIAIFGLVIASIFAFYPSSVFPIWIQIPIAVAVGFLAYRRTGNVLVASLIALVLMYVSIWIGAYYWPLDLTSPAIGIPLNGEAAVAAGGSPYVNAIVIWTAILLVYCFVASVLPVWTLLQPRDFINSNQLVIVMGLLFIGMLVYPMEGRSLEFVADAVNPNPPPDAPPILPFLFVTIACGAVSGFHCLVSSGTTSKQLRRETDAQMVGYGAMLLEGGLAVLVIICCCAGLSGGVYEYHSASGDYMPILGADHEPLTGVAAWGKYYGRNWGQMSLGELIGGFIEGGANVLSNVGLPIRMGIAVMAVLVCCFASTTLDTATRLQRYVITELGAATGVPGLRNKYVATLIAVLSGGAIALYPGPKGPGSGGLILWPIFGATNQLLAGLSFLVVAFYLLRHRKPVWFIVGPMFLMLIIPTWVLLVQVFGRSGWLAGGQWGLVFVGLVTLVLEGWMVAEGVLLWNRARGVPPSPLPPLRAAEGALGS
jgi:carbon starvation protein